MTLILKDKPMTLDEFNKVERNVNRKLTNWPEVMFNSWYYKGTGHFKISQKHIEILSLELYMVGDLNE